MEATLHALSLEYNEYYALAPRKSGKTQALITEAIRENAAACAAGARQIFFAKNIDSAQQARDRYLRSGCARAEFREFDPSIDLRGAFVYVDDAEHVLGTHAHANLIFDARKIRAVGTKGPNHGHVASLLGIHTAELSNEPRHA